MHSWDAFGPTLTSCCSRGTDTHECVPACSQPVGFPEPIEEFSSHFNSLLHRVAVEHDREIMHLRTEIAFLRGQSQGQVSLWQEQFQGTEIGGRAESALPTSTSAYDNDACKAVTEEEQGTTQSTLCLSEVMPMIDFAEMEEQAPQERNPIPDNCRSEELAVDSAQVVEQAAEPSAPDPIAEEGAAPSKPRFSKAVSSVSSLECGKQLTFNTSVTTTSLEDGIDFCTSSATGRNFRHPLDMWQTLIKAVQGSGGGCVKLDPKWHYVLERASSEHPFADAHEFVELAQKRLIERVITMKFALPDRQSMVSLGRLGPSVIRVIPALLPYLIFTPTSRLRMSWDVLGFLLLLHDIAFVPLQVFESGTSGLGREYVQFIETFDIFAVIFWTCDIMTSFLTAYYTEEGFLEQSHSKIAWNYIRSWFLPDLVIVTVDWVSLTFNFNAEVGYFRIGKTMSRFMRVLRLMRFVKLNEQFSKMMEAVNSEVIFTIVGVMKLLVGMIFANHYVACGWYGLAQLDFATSWTKRFLDGDEMGYAYLSSLHWSLTQFTPASMEVHPTNMYERIYTIVVIICAMVFFSSFISSITGAMTHLRTVNATKAEQDASFRQYFAMHKISKEVASQVWHFRRRNKLATKSRIKESDLPAVKYLPERIREQLRVEVYSPILRQHPLFEIYGEICPEGMKQICNEAMSERQVLAGEDVKELKDQVLMMFFVCYGSMEYFTEEKGQEKRLKLSATRAALEFVKRSVRTTKQRQTQIRQSTRLQHYFEINKVSKGQWACEVALWSSTPRINGNFVASENGCELVFLTAATLKDILLGYPRCVDFMAEYAQLFVQTFNKAHHSHIVTNRLFNDVGTINSILHGAKRQTMSGRASRASKMSKGAS